MRFDPAVMLKILILKSLSTLLVDQIELQQSGYTVSIHAGNWDTAFRPTLRSWLRKKNAKSIFSLDLSGIGKCSKTEF